MLVTPSESCVFAVGCTTRPVRSSAPTDVYAIGLAPAPVAPQPMAAPYPAPRYAQGRSVAATRQSGPERAYAASRELTASSRYERATMRPPRCRVPSPRCAEHGGRARAYRIAIGPRRSTRRSEAAHTHEHEHGRAREHLRRGAQRRE